MEPVPVEEVRGDIVVRGDVVRPSSFYFMQTSEKPESVMGVRGHGCLPPFLSKIFIMVEDPDTNYIISWSSSGTSFIIWDHLMFTKEILPKYFRHNNLSSFIYQLNNYGFRKIGLRQYEYENEWFQAGKANLLQNINRRNERPTYKRQRRSRNIFLNPEMYEMEAELKNMRNNNNLVKLEIQKLKQQNGDFQNKIANFRQHEKKMDTKSQMMLVFLTSSFSPSIVQQIIQYVEEEQELIESHESMTKTGLVSLQSTEKSSKPINEENNPTQGINSGGPIRNQEASNSISEIWKKLLELEDDSVCENEAEQHLAEQHFKIGMALDDLMASKIVMEVEDVIAKKSNMDMEDEVTFQLWA